MKISRCVGLVENAWTVQMNWDDLNVIITALRCAYVESDLADVYGSRLSALKDGKRAFMDLEELSYDYK